MNVLLNFCHKDREQALDLIRWIGELGSGKGHDLILQSSIMAAANGLVSELQLAAQDVFRHVSVRVTDIQDERGWPFSCNVAWIDAVFFMRHRTMSPWEYITSAHPPNSQKWKDECSAASIRFNKPWLWLEPDAVPLQADWLDQIEAAYTECAARAKPKFFLGGEVKQPQHRMSGVAVYPCFVAQFTRGLPYISNNTAPWDQVLAADFAPWAELSPLIQDVWNKVLGDPSTEPTFPDAESLAFLDPKAVLFHRCKDGTLIKQLREKKGGDLPCAIPDIQFAPTSASNAAPMFDPEVAALRKRIIELESKQLDSAIKSTLKRITKTRTPEKIAADRERMARVRAARKVTA